MVGYRVVPGMGFHPARDDKVNGFAVSTRGNWFTPGVLNLPTFATKEPTMTAKKKFTYVVSREHYHFPPNDSDMVASTPLFVTKDWFFAITEAYKFARERFKNDTTDSLKEYDNASSLNREYRVWIDSTNPNHDRFVWVVRQTEVR